MLYISKTRLVIKQFKYIYKITNITNGKIYNGKHSTDDLNDGYMGSGKIIKQAIKKYGIENFTKEYLVFCDKEDKLNWFEIFYIKKYGSTDRNIGYNLSYGGEGGGIPCEETRRKMSEARKGIPKSEEHKRRIGDAQIGELNHNYGKHPSEETLIKLSLASKGSNNGMFGKHHSDEARRKISDSHKGKHPSEETLIKLRLASTGINNHMFGKHKQKLKWLTPNGDIKEMDIGNVHKWHPDWTLVEE